MVGSNFNFCFFFSFTPSETVAPGLYAVSGGGAPVLSDVVHVCELTYKAHTVTIGG